MILNQLSTKSVSKKIWNFDVVLCVLFLLLGPYFILDVFFRSLTGNNLFQFEWIFIVIASLRLILISFAGSTTEKRFLIFALKVFTPLFIVIIYTLVLTFLQIDFLLENNIYFETISNGFIVKRGVKYLIYIFFALYFATVVNTWKKFYTLLMFFLAGLCIAEVLGLIQEVVFLETGIDILPITRTYEAGFINQSATVNFAGRNFLRVNSLAHEPKGLASLLYVLLIFKFYISFLLTQAQRHIRIPYFFDKYLRKSLPLTFLVFILTFSGSGLISLGFLCIVLLSSSLGSSLSSGKLSTQFRLMLVLIFAIVVINVQFSDQVFSFLDASILRRSSAFFEERTLESLYSGSTDPEDAAVIINILKFPQLILTGIGFGGYSNLAISIISPMYGLSVQEAPAFSRNILIELLFSSGLVGVIGCLFFYKRLFENNFKLYHGVFTPFALIIISFFLIRSSEILFFVTIGMTCSASRIVFDENRT